MHDPNLDFLQSVRLSGAVFLQADFTAPWCVGSKLSEEECRQLGAQPGRVIAYHYLASGTALVKVAGGAEVALEPGDVVLLPRNDDHILGSDLKLPPAISDAHIVAGEDGMFRMTYGGGGARTELFCGYLAHDASLCALLSALPPLVRLNFRQMECADWIESTFRYAARQMTTDPFGRRPDMIARMAELLFIEGLRRHLMERSETTLLKASRDDSVARAVALLHADLGRGWTTEDLAAEVAMSRSAFADRFTRLIGAPPMRYLAQRRLEEASRRLVETGVSVANIAFAVGYESEAAFTRSFKKTYGLPPRTWRKKNGSGSPTPR